MENDTTTDTSSVAASNAAETDHTVVAEELLVEEISIDGMCGVY